MYPLNFYWRLTRPHTLSASIIPVLSGISFAASQKLQIHPILALILLTTAVIIQIATNLFNEYFDYKNGLDTEESVGIGGAIVREGLEPNTVLFSALGLFIISGILGMILSIYSSLLLIPIGAFCLLIAYCYTGGPYPISRTPFGEIFAGTLMGSGLFLIAYFIQTSEITLYAILVSLPLNILTGLLLTANSLRDRLADKKNGRRTLAILLGHKKTVLFMIFFFSFVYIWLFVLIMFGETFCILLPLFSIPFAIKCIKSYSNINQTPQQMMKGMLYCSKLNKYFGILYVISFFLKYIYLSYF